MKAIAFITNYQAVDRIIDYFKLTFVAEKPPPSRIFTEVMQIAPLFLIHTKWKRTISLR